jgi:hypothetical protein
MVYRTEKWWIFPWLREITRWQHSKVCKFSGTESLFIFRFRVWNPGECFGKRHEVTELCASCESSAMFGADDLHRGDVGAAPWEAMETMARLIQL